MAICKTTVTEKSAIDQEDIDLSFLGEDDAAFNRICIGYCQAIYAEFTDLPRKRKKQQASVHGWETTSANPYIKVGECFGSLPIENIELLDLLTLKMLAADKYQPIHRILQHRQLTVIQVREMAREINEETRTEKAAAKQMEWIGEPRHLKILIPDGASAMGFESDYKQMSESFKQHQQSELPMALYIKQVNQVVKENKLTIAEALGIELEPLRDASSATDNQGELGTDEAMPLDEIALSVDLNEDASQESEYLEPADIEDDDEEVDSIQQPIYLESTLRYKKGWEIGQAVRLNTTAQKVAVVVAFSGNSPYLIVREVSKKLTPDTIQKLQLMRPDGEICQFDCWGNWVEDDDAQLSRIEEAVSGSKFNSYKHLIKLGNLVKTYLTATEENPLNEELAKKKIVEMKEFAKENVVWFDENQMHKGKMVFTPDGTDYIADFSPLHYNVIPLFP